ncbi:protocadherin Fat 1 isoform X1 [Brachionus plicatilis]|uniref:Protocadherin Fat 1 isoform X1 n=1 Tax=Brachionus plicatilis TaxID=10195 RepID=A0A3M7R1F9_BRAPC|nr:protocadherin Fat 1 isoform X1 [Brachionus plicatilis]
MYRDYYYCKNCLVSYNFLETLDHVSFKFPVGYYARKCDMFEIDKNRGGIYLKQKIADYDTQEFNFVVKSSQVDNQLRSCVSTVTIRVVDTNNKAPTFTSKLYQAEIVENSAPGTIVIQVQADDQDQNRVQYSIENSHEFPFTIEQYTGVIRVSSRIDYEMSQHYQMQVSAFDGKFSRKCLVNIAILNVVDKAPSFQYNFYNFKIKIPHDVFIGQVKAFDVEQTSNLTYSLHFANHTDSQLFCITQTGTIYLCSHLFDSRKHIDQVLLNFDQDEYKFNVSVQIYSDYTKSYLSNSVACKIQIESKSIDKAKKIKKRIKVKEKNRDN